MAVELSGSSVKQPLFTDRVERLSVEDGVQVHSVGSNGDVGFRWTA